MLHRVANKESYCIMYY
uniref:Uncharacterized protein n=1 Tax=Anguilla anguilla TaxID=7936 RepID=A0A0E9SIC3_ANGAN